MKQGSSEGETGSVGALNTVFPGRTYELGAGKDEGSGTFLSFGAVPPCLVLMYQVFQTPGIG